MKAKPLYWESGTAFLWQPQNNKQATNAATLCNLPGKGRLWNLIRTNHLHAENAQFRDTPTYAAGLNTSERSGSCLSTMNFAKIWPRVLSRRNSGRPWRRAVVTTRSDGARPGRIVRSQEPNERQTRSG